MSLDFISLFFGGAEVSHGNSGSEFRAAEKQKIRNEPDGL